MSCFGIYPHNDNTNIIAPVLIITQRYVKCGAKWGQDEQDEACIVPRTA